MKKQLIKGYDVPYYVDACGNVYDRYERKLKPKKYANEYLYVTFILNGAEVNRLIHILVAKAFIKNPQCKLLVNHKDLNRCNNNVSNLEWCTHSENQHHHLKIRGNCKKK